MQPSGNLWTDPRTCPRWQPTRFGLRAGTPLKLDPALSPSRSKISLGTVYGTLLHRRAAVADAVDDRDVHVSGPPADGAECGVQGVVDRRGVTREGLERSTFRCLMRRSVRGRMRAGSLSWRRQVPRMRGRFSSRVGGASQHVVPLMIGLY